MQFKTAALSLFVALAAADSISDLAAQIPSCATSCLNDGAKQAGCATTDYTCQCTNIASITSSSGLCIATACSSDDLQKTSQATTNLCLAVAEQVGGDTFTSALDSLTGAAGSAFTSATGAIGSAFTSATGAAESAITSATGAAGSAFTSATGAAGSALTSATGAAGSALTSATGAAGSVLSSATDAAVTPTSTPAAANQAVAGMGMVGAAALLALAL
ncbi:hypothetical protein GGS24DRAFT_277683 [Hypoxylon argillaceum]|nr:hypothetical protein GGS24DRAFT_277683 [Hypoxylon argillaceum]